MSPLFITPSTTSSEKIAQLFSLCFAFSRRFAVWFRSIYALIALSLFDCQRRLFSRLFSDLFWGTPIFIFTGQLFLVHYLIHFLAGLNNFSSKKLRFQLTLPIIRARQRLHACLTYQAIMLCFISNRHGIPPITIPLTVLIQK